MSKKKHTGVFKKILNVAAIATVPGYAEVKAVKAIAHGVKAHKVEKASPVHVVQQNIARLHTSPPKVHTQSDIQTIFGGNATAAANSILTPKLIAYMRTMPAEELHELSMKHLGIDLSQHIVDETGAKVALNNSANG